MAELKDTIGTKEQQILIDRIAEYLSGKSGSTVLVVKGFIRKALADGIDAGDLKAMKEISEKSVAERQQQFQGAVKRTIEYLNLDLAKEGPECVKIYEQWKKDFSKG